MVTVRNVAKTWVAKEGDLYIDWAGNIDFLTTSTLSGAFATSGISIAAACKNITITPPDTNWEKQDFIGRDTNSFQNQLLDEKPVGTATCNFSMIVGEDETIEDHIVSGTVTSPAGYTRRMLGYDDVNKTVATCIVLGPTSGKQIAFAFDNARITKWGDVKIAGPDGHWEQEVTLICLTKDFYYEFKD